MTSVWIALAGLLVAVVTYSAQRHLDRQHSILSERRRLYEDSAAAIAKLMYKKVNINSEHHTSRRDAMNVMGQRLFVLAPLSVRKPYSQLVERLSDKERQADPEGNVEDYFDARSQEILDELLEKMRADALPHSMLKK